MNKLIAGTLSALALAGATAVPALASTTSQGLGQPGQWGLDVSDGTLDGTYHYTATGQGVDIYVLDTGTDQAQPDLAGRVSAGYDAVGAAGGPATPATTDCYGHGTHMAGLAAGTTYGIAKAAHVIPVRVQECDYTSDIRYYRAAITWMINDHRAGVPAVANMSFDERHSAELDDLVQRAIDDGITVVVASGNLGEGNGDTSCAVSPADNPNTIRVGGVQQGNSGLTWYTEGNPGSCIDLLAPGYNITSDLPHAGSALGTGSGMLSGTSQSTALVTGAAALVLQQHPTWTPAQVKAQLVATADRNVVSGVPAGTPNLLLDALAASQSATPAPSPTPVSTPSPGPAPVSSPSATPTPVRTSPVAPAPTAAPARPVTAFRVAWAPRLTGRPAVGATLTTDGGGWIPGATSKQVRWYRLGASRTLVGSGGRYVVQRADAGARLQVCVTASRAGFRSTTSCSAASAAVAGRVLAPTGTPGLAGSTTVGGTVRTTVRWSTAPSSVHYQWYRVAANGRATAILGATGPSRTTTAADAGSRLRVLVTASRAGWVGRPTWSVVSAPIHR